MPLFSTAREIQTRRQIRVWLVDDDATNRNLLAELLNGENEIECSQSFSSAEDVLIGLGRETPPDVMLLDVQMGGQSGIEALPRIKSLAPATQVVILTTFYDGEAKSQALRDGASGFMLKREPIRRIVDCIRQAYEHTAPSPQIPAAHSSAKPGLSPFNRRFRIKRRFLNFLIDFLSHIQFNLTNKVKT